MSRSSGRTGLWNDFANHCSQGRDELAKALHPDWPSQGSGQQPAKDMSQEPIGLDHDGGSTLDSRLESAAGREDIGRDDRDMGMERE